MDIIRKKNMRNKIIFVGLVLFAPLLAVQLVILWLLSNDIIGVLVAAILTAVVIIAMTTVVIRSLWTFFYPLVSIFLGNSTQKNNDNKIMNKINKLSQRSDGVGEMVRTANTAVADFAEVITGIKYSIEKLESVSAEFQSTFHEMESFMLNTSDNVNTITTNTLSQVDNTYDMKDKIAAISMAIENINTNVKALSRSAEVVESYQQNAENIMEELMDMSKECNAAIEEVKNQTERTNQSAQQIHTAAEIISDISNQTNLLALNASIEAARAGEHGAGFAVVAEEVRILADESKKSTEHINNIVNELLANSDISVQITEQVSQFFAEQNKKVEETGNIFRSLNDEIIQVGEAIKDIDSEMTQLDKNKVVIENSADNITSFAEENAKQVESTSANVSGIHDMVENCTIMTEKVTSVSQELVGYVRKFDKSPLVDE